MTLRKKEDKPMTPPPAMSQALRQSRPELLASKVSEMDAADARERARLRLRKVLLPLLGALAFVLFWAIYTSRQGVTLPGPVQTVTQSWNYIAHPFFENGPNDKGLGWHLMASLLRVAMGYGLAVVLGVGLGIFIGKFNAAHQALDPIFQVLRTIPPLAWLPLSLATFNQAQPSAIFVIFITALWPILINTSVGVMRIPKDYENLAKIYQLKGSRYFFLILLPAAAPYIFTGLRISIGMAWLAIVAAEMLTGGVGIGFFIWDSWNSSRMSDIIVSVAYVGAVGFALDRVVALLASRFGAKND
jgi:nitrate/nitrite transport system permease protein